MLDGSGFECGDVRFYIEPLKNYKPTSDKLAHFAYKTTDTKFSLDLSDDAITPPPNQNGIHLNSLYQNDNMGRIWFVTHKYPTTLTAQIILDCDKEFYNINPSTWLSRQLSVINDASADYNSQIDIQFSVVQQACDASNAQLTSTTASTLLTQLKNRWSPNPANRDLVHLFTGKDVRDAAGNGPLGLAYQHGVHTPTTTGYGLTQHVTQSGYSASAYQKEVLVAHETGHGFSATHEAAMTVNGRYSIMWPTFQGDLMMDIFSDGSQGATKNNEATIRNEGTAHL